jgi:hypothetical protein
MPTILKNQTIKPQFISFIELSKTASPRYHALVSIDFDINAEIASHCHIRGDLNRPLSGGHSEPVSYSHGGLLSGVRRLQHGLSRKTRIVFSKTTMTPDNSGDTLKLNRVTIMTALSACNNGVLAPNQTAKPTPTTQSHSLRFVDNPNNTIIAYKQGSPVAWIVAGYHQGQLNKQPKTCTFVDVAYHRTTQHGVNLETFEARSVDQAKQVLNHLLVTPVYSEQGVNA